MFGRKFKKETQQALSVLMSEVRELNKFKLRVEEPAMYKVGLKKKGVHIIKCWWSEDSYSWRYSILLHGDLRERLYEHEVTNLLK